MGHNACARKNQPERQLRDTNNVSTGPAAPGWTREEMEEVIACLCDDTAATSASAHQETHRLQADGAGLQDENEREELIRLRGEHPVMQRLMGDLLSVVLTVDGEGEDEEAELLALVQRTRNALAGLVLRPGRAANHKDRVLGEGSVAMRG